MAIDIKDAKPAESRRRGPRLPSLGGILKLAALLVLLTVAAGMVGLAAGWRPSLNPFTETTVDRSSPAVLRSLEDLAEFNASSGHFEVIVDLEEDTDWLPSWVSGERVLFVGVGTVDSVVSFEGLDESRIVVSDDRTSVTVRLPAPKLEEPRLDLDQSYLYTRQRGVLNRVGGMFSEQAVEQPVYQKAADQIRAAAVADDQILSLGKRNTTSMLEGIFRASGFTSVVVTFDEGG